jgi:hypothetical protein
MPGNQMTNVQRALFLNALRDAWPHVLKNPSDLHSTVSDILNRLNIKRTVSRGTIKRYGAELGLPPLPKLVNREAQLAAISRARAALTKKHSTPPVPTPDYTTILTQINASLQHIVSAITRTNDTIHSHSNSLALQLDAIRIALEPSRKENT